MARIVADLLPGEPEALGLLALMLLTDARRPAREGPDGALVRLEDQDRSRWDAARVEEGRSLTEQPPRVGGVGPYQLQAAIERGELDGPAGMGASSMRSTPVLTMPERAIALPQTQYRASAVSVQKQPPKPKVELQSA